MKITKIAAENQMIPQNPSAQNDPDIQLQNLQNAQVSFQKLKEYIDGMNIVMADLRELEQNLDIADIGARSEVQKIILASIQQTPDYNLLAQMGLITSVESLLNQGEADRINISITQGIANISSAGPQAVLQ